MNAATKLSMVLLALSGPMSAQAEGVGVAPGPAQPQGQACSVPPFTEQYVSTGSAQWSTDAEGCGLDAALTSGVSAAAVAHYARRPDLGNLRMRFRVDLSALTGLNAVQAVQLLAGVAAAGVPAGSEATAQLLSISVFGNVSGTQTRLGFFAACAGQPANRCSATTLLTTLQPTIGLDWHGGPAGVGQLRWWVDTDFDQAPTGSLALDNQAWGALERVVLGLASPSQSFMANQGGRTVRFDRIDVFEDQLAWQDFESLERGSCSLDPAPPRIIGSGGTAISGSTCGGTWDLTTVASGSTTAYGPERNYRVQITGVGLEQSPRPVWMLVDAGSDPAIHAFLCERACSPSARCQLVSGTQAVHGVFEPGDYRLVVKVLSISGCGSWSVNFASVLK